MNRQQLARLLAKQAGISAAAAADQLDSILTGILRRVRQGHSASLPGLGTFLPGPRPRFQLEQCLPPGARRAKAAKGAKAPNRIKAKTGSR
jgi:hypothetical protein